MLFLSYQYVHAAIKLFPATDTRNVTFALGCGFRTWVGLFMFTKEFRNYTKENMPVQYFGSSLLMNGLIFARSSLDCHIFNTLSVDTHIGYSKSHKAIWLYGFMAIIWLYGCIAIWLYGSLSSQYGCLRKEH